MATIDSERIAELSSIKVSDLARSNLGIHFNFEQSISILEKYQVFLIEITNKAGDKLTSSEVRTIEKKITEFLDIVRKIQKFNPQQNDNAQTHTALVDEIKRQCENATESLRHIHNFLALSNLDLNKIVEHATSLESRFSDNIKQVDQLVKEINKLPTETETRYNQLYTQVQEQFNIQSKVFQSEIQNINAQNESVGNGLASDFQKRIDRFSKELQVLTETTHTKIEEVQQQARKFSAKEALTTYSQIFSDEAQENRKQIRKWELILVCFIAIEIGIALWLFLFFLPEILNIAILWGSSVFGAGLIVSIVLIKVFILSAIAILIAYAVKNLNAQNHLYSTNKFKSNSLASFQAFIDATTDDNVINQIIQQVSIAVYSQTVSGYLSKDDSGMGLNTKDALELTSKIIDKAK